MIIVELGIQIKVCNKLYLNLKFRFLGYLITIIVEMLSIPVLPKNKFV